MPDKLPPEEIRKNLEELYRHAEWLVCFRMTEYAEEMAGRWHSQLRDGGFSPDVMWNNSQILKDYAEREWKWLAELRATLFPKPEEED